MKQRTPWARRVGVALILFWSLAPLYWAVNISLQTDAQAASKPSNYLPPTPSLNNYFALLSGNSDLSQSIRQSSINIVIECAAATIVTIVLATLAAYAFARMTFKGRKILFYTVLATMAFPAYTTLIPIYQILTGLSLVNTYAGIILVYVSGFLPLATWILYNYMSSLPIALEEAGTIDGASRMQVLWHIVLPLARPGVISTAIITFLFAWGQFLFPLVLSSDLSTQPLTVVIASIQGRHIVPYTLLSAAGVIALAVPAAIALILNRYIVSGLLAGSVK
jgi:multiple sugar transport system permease protein